ncbi:hypothetical protein [Acinetobacter sp. P1(2025)]|uniref:hypothetical protein n=1 Tax=Acinetobacter sp. P1(2025) TaxID=3446120 RepID=UPI003F5381C5
MSIFNKIFHSKQSRSIDDNTEALKAKGFTLKDGLYRNTDGSTPTLADFKELGFTKDEYFKLVYGTSQTELQSKVMLPTRINRNMRFGVMNNRIKLNMANKNKPTTPTLAKNDDWFDRDIFGYSMFTPYGVFGSLNNLSRLSVMDIESVVLGYGFFYEHISDPFFGQFGDDQHSFLNSMTDGTFDHGSTFGHDSFHSDSHSTNHFDSHNHF